MKDIVRSYVQEIQTTLDRLPWDAIDRIIGVLRNACLEGRQVLTMGNGGSAMTASHFACDLGKGTRMPGGHFFRVVALTDNFAMFSAYANDCGYDQVFSQRLATLMRPGDVVIGISGSGNSANVIKAMQVAREGGATTIGFVGFDGGRLKDVVDYCLHVENNCMEQVEDVHLVLEHLICSALRCGPIERQPSPTGGKASQPIQVEAACDGRSS
jgi:D-sedoheptulose 7-phosphate isomerase